MQPRARMPSLTAVTPVAQHRGRDPQLIGNLHQRPTAARQQCYRLRLELIRKPTPFLTHSTPSRSPRSLAKVSTDSGEAQRGVPVVCLEARHARAATALQRNKTDANDAETLAQLVRTGWYREARVKSFAAHATRHLVGARAQLMGVSVDLSNQIRSTLKTFGSPCFLLMPGDNGFP